MPERKKYIQDMKEMGLVVDKPKSGRQHFFIGNLGGYVTNENNCLFGDKYLYAKLKTHNI